MGKQKVRIEDGGVTFADYDGPVTRFQIEDDIDQVKVTIWLPRPKPKGRK